MKKVINFLLITVLPVALQGSIGLFHFQTGRFMEIMIYITAIMLAIFTEIEKRLEENNKTLFYIFTENKIAIIAFTFIFACIPPLLALIESDFGDKSMIASRDYIKGNFLFNIIGALVTSSIFWWSTSSYYELKYLKKVIIKLLINLSMPISFIGVLDYQSMEFQKHVADHSASLINNINQNANVLYLIFTFNIAVVSLICKSGYIHYARKNGSNVKLGKKFYIAMSVAITFFYLYASNPRPYLQIMYLIFVPIIILYSMFMALYLERTEELFKVEMLFATFHMLVYIIFVLWNMKVIELSNSANYLYWIMIVLSIIVSIIIVSLCGNDPEDEDTDSCDE